MDTRTGKWILIPPLRLKLWLQGSLFLATGLMLSVGTARANSIAVTNIALTNTVKSAGTTDVTFDLGWSNSWRASWAETNTPEGSITVTNWDAAWVFIKYHVTEGPDTNWHHAFLSTTGHRASTGTTIAVGANGGATNVGAFVYRSTNGYGTLSLTNMRLRWNYAANGVSITSPIAVSAHAIEMVYISQGSFYVGSGGGTNWMVAWQEAGSFTDGAWTEGTSTSFPFRITGETALLMTNAAGYLWGTWTNGSHTIGSPGVLPSAFPKGYNAFYCMKYEITQGQYTEFLNRLTYSQATNRFPGTGTWYHRQTIGTNALGIYTNGSPDWAGTFLSWADVTAYTDWAGLRPMTELEFEKACRGPKMPVPLEFAWGNTSDTALTNEVGTPGSGTETKSPAGANCHVRCYSGLGGLTNNYGPTRVGIFATDATGRRDSGASYYGVMELSGNIYERAVTVGNADGRIFTGTHGDGTLENGSGNANTAYWPGTSASGAGGRGGGFPCYTYYIRTSDRARAAITDSGRGGHYYSNGGRAVRTAP